MGQIKLEETKINEKELDQGHKDWSVQTLDRGGIIVDIASRDWRACPVAASVIHDQGPQMERAYE